MFRPEHGFFSSEYWEGEKILFKNGVRKVFICPETSFLSLVRRYTDITELTAEIIRTFVERIEVQQPEKVPGTRTKKQTIAIIWNFIGAVDIPEETKKTA